MRQQVDRQRFELFWQRIRRLFRRPGRIYLVGGIQYNLVMAAAFVAVLPCLVIFFIFQEHLVGGIALSGLKG